MRRISEARQKAWLITAWIVLTFCSCSQESQIWAKARRANSVSSYQNYLGTYPQGKHAAQARKGLGMLLWQEAKEKWAAEEDIPHLLAQYDEFVRAFPENPYLGQARGEVESIAFAMADKAASLGAYQDFFASFGDGPLAEKARAKIDEYVAPRHALFKDARTALVRITESYGSANKLKGGFLFKEF